MTIACPKCAAQFRDPPPDLPSDQPLQCGKCSHEWLPAPDKSDAQIKPEIHMADLVAMDDDAIRTNLPVIVEQVDTDSELERPPLYVEKPSTLPRKRSGLALMSLMALAIVTIGAIGGSILLREQVMNRLPATLAFYQALGLAPAVPGLEIANVVTTRVREDGIRKLIVRGEIANVAEHAVPVPPIKLIMRNHSAAHVYAWTVTAAKPSLGVGERSRFMAVAQDYPLDAVNVEVEFVPKEKEDTTSSRKNP